MSNFCWKLNHHTPETSYKEEGNTENKLINSLTTENPIYGVAKITLNIVKPIMGV